MIVPIIVVVVITLIIAAAAVVDTGVTNDRHFGPLQGVLLKFPSPLPPSMYVIPPE